MEHILRTIPLAARRKVVEMPAPETKPIVAIEGNLDNLPDPRVVREAASAQIAAANARNPIPAISDPDYDADAPPVIRNTPRTQDVEAGPLDIPTSAMYGWLAGAAQELHSPLAWAYCALLAAYAGQGINMGQASPNPRPTVYVTLIGGYGSGKSVTMDRAVALLGLDERILRCDTQGSDRGFVNSFGGKVKSDDDSLPLTAHLILHDEQLATMKKIAIKGSNLQQTYCTAWSKDKYATTDKQGRYAMNARISYLGGLMVADPTDFGDAFGVETAAGLADRFIIAPPPAGRWKFDHAWVPPVSPRYPANVSMPLDVRRHLERVSDELQASGNPLGRLAEIAARVAMITASANQEEQVSIACMDAAIEFARWQQRVRAEYTVGEAEHPDARLEQIIIKAMKDALIADRDGKPHLCEGKNIVRDGRWISWRLMAKKHTWGRKHGSTNIERIRRALVTTRQIEEFDAPPTNKGERPQGTNEYRLKGKWDVD